MTAANLAPQLAAPRSPAFLQTTALIPKVIGKRTRALGQ